MSNRKKARKLQHLTKQVTHLGKTTIEAAQAVKVLHEANLQLTDQITALVKNIDERIPMNAKDPIGYQ